MKKHLIRSAILAKRHLISPGFWITEVFIISLLLLLGLLVLPAASNSRLGLVNEGGAFSEEVANDLLTSDSPYEWVLFKNESALKDAVARGSVDSGFILTSALDDAAGNIPDSYVPETDGAVRVITTTSSTKDSAAKELIAALLLKHYSPHIMEAMVRNGEIFEDSSDSAAEMLMAELPLTASEEVLFDVVFERIGEDGGRDDAPAAGTETSGRNGRAAAIILFAAALLFGISARSDHSASTALRGMGARFAFTFTDTAAPLIITGFIALAVMFAAGLTTMPRALLILPLLIPAALWAAAFVSVIKKETICLFMAVILILISVALVGFDDAVSVIPGLSKVRYLLPASWLAAVL